MHEEGQKWTGVERARDLSWIEEGLGCRWLGGGVSQATTRHQKWKWIRCSENGKNS
jgi:hypothetical protein